MDDLYGRLASEIANITDDYYGIAMEAGGVGGGVFGGNLTISHLVDRRVVDRVGSYDAQLARYLSAYRSNVTRLVGRSVTKYGRYLRRVFDDGWFSFQQFVFRHGAGSGSSGGGGGGGDAKRPLAMAAGGGGGSGGAVVSRPKKALSDEVEFGAFLQIVEVENVHAWSVKFRERLENLSDFVFLRRRNIL